MKPIKALRLRKPVASGGDPSWSSVVMLLSCDGTNGSTTFTDESPAAHGNATVAGQAQVDTSDKKFGTGSALFDGAGDELSWADSNDWNLAAGSFTLECWAKPATVAAGTRTFFGQWEAVGFLGWIVYQSGAALAFNLSTTGSDNIVQLSGGTLATSWQHICIDFNGTKYRAYIDGTMVASSTTLRTINNSSYRLSVGATDAASLPYNGRIDEVRITKGVARYASDSGFTVPSAAFPRS